jgi:hypothetical protein
MDEYVSFCIALLYIDRVFTSHRFIVQVIRPSSWRFESWELIMSRKKQEELTRDAWIMTHSKSQLVAKIVNKFPGFRETTVSLLFSQLLISCTTTLILILSSCLPLCLRSDLLGLFKQNVPTRCQCTSLKVIDQSHNHTKQNERLRLCIFEC